MKENTLAQWFRQMAVLLNCGIPAIKALDICYRQSSNPTIRQASQTILDELRVGVPLSRAMRVAGTPFEALHYGAVEVGENHGDLPLVFSRLADHSEEVARVKHKLISALAYPALVLSVSFFGLYLLVRFLSPVLADVALQLGEEPTALSQFMLFLGNIFENELLTLGILLLSFFSLRAILRVCWRYHRKRMEAFLFNLPLIGKLFRLCVLIRISQTLETMVGGGLPLTNSLHLTAETCGSAFYAEEVLQPCIDRIRLGESLARSLDGAPGLPASFRGLIIAGEESGNLDHSFAYLCHLYEMELVNAIDTFLAALEPISIACVGVVVLGVLLSVFEPLSRLVSSV